MRELVSRTRLVRSSELGFWIMMFGLTLLVGGMVVGAIIDSRAVIGTTMLGGALLILLGGAIGLTSDRHRR